MLFTGELVFLHTAKSNEAVFSGLMTELAPDSPARHVVDEALLNDAVAEGRVTDDIERRLCDRIHEAAKSGAGLVVCTCSTMGLATDRAAEAVDVPVLRIDRAMAEKAVSIGRRCLVAAALRTTVEPTESLIRDVARARGVAVDIKTVVFDDAWSRFKAGDQAGYVGRVAEGLRRAAKDIDVVVLAQASMAKAAERCRDIDVPILTSPRLGAEAAVAAYVALTEARR